MKKPSGTQNLYLRDNFWWTKLYCDGRPIYRSTKCQKIEDARKVRDQLIAQKTRGELSAGKPDKVLINELLDDVLKSDIKESTRYIWGLVVKKHLRPYFGHIRASRLTTAMLEAYRTKRVAAGVCQSTVNRELTTLQVAMRSATKSTPPKVLRVPHFQMRKETTIREGFLADEDYTKLFDAIKSPEVRLFFTIAYHSGVRKGELLQVRWNQVEWETEYLRLNADTTKTGKSRKLPLYGDMLTLLKEAKQFRDANYPDCEWLFHKDGKQVKDFREEWAAATKEAGVPDLHIHDLRRTAVRNMRRAGVPQVMRMLISGHRSTSMEMRYNIADEEDLEMVKEKLENGARNGGRT